MSNQRWKQRPPGSNWGDWGEDDELGRINLLTREKVRQGLAEATEGIAFSLSLPLDYPGGSAMNQRRYPPILKPTEDLAHNQDVFYNVIAREQIAPIFNDVWSDDPVSLSFARRLGLEHMAAHGVQGRGVLIDLERHLGREHQPVDFATLSDIMRRDDVVVEPGDMVLLHTGFATQILEWGKQPDPVKIHDMAPYLDAHDDAILQWITDSQLSALVADNYAVEGVVIDRPADLPVPHSLLPIHNLCLFKLGIPLGELWYLDELAMWLHEQGRSRFLLTAPPLRLPGTQGSPLTPVATV